MAVHTIQEIETTHSGKVKLWKTDTEDYVLTIFVDVFLGDKTYVAAKSDENGTKKETVLEYWGGETHEDIIHELGFQIVP